MADQYVNGRRLILQALDSMLAETHNIKTMRNAFQERLDAEPMTFFKEVILPLMPKDSLGLTPEDDAKNRNQHITVEFKPAPPPTTTAKE